MLWHIRLNVVIFHFHSVDLSVLSKIDGFQEPMLMKPLGGCGGLRRTRFGLIDGGSTTLFTEKTAFNFSQSLKSLVIYTLRHSSS